MAVYERLAPRPTELLDRGRRITFYYRGRPFSAHPGETIAAALLANGVTVFSRSFKYHRPRGPFCLAGHCSHCLMRVDGQPNVRTCRETVREGMRVEPQNVVGSPERDLLGVADSFSFLMPTGFYYKALHKPPFLWPQAAKLIRRAAGLGKLLPSAQEPLFDQVHLHPEVLVIGGGLAGLAAAQAAAKAGVRVVLVEAEPRLGGFEAFQGAEALAPAIDLARPLAELANVTLLPRTTASAAYSDGLILAVAKPAPEEPFLERTYLIRPRTVIFATGAGDRPLVFGNNDRPGVLLGQAAQRLIHLFGLRPGRRAVVAGGAAHLYRVAVDLVQAGVEVTGLVDFRTRGFDEDRLAELARAGVAFLPGRRLGRVWGLRKIEGVEVVREGAASPIFLEAETVVVSGGRWPQLKLLAQAGARLVRDPELNLYLPQELPPHLFVAGRAAGLTDREAILASGRLAGLQALASLGHGTKPALKKAADALARRPGPRPVAAQPWPEEDGAKKFVCFCSDVTDKDLEASVAQGFDSVELAKRFTTASMGPCQAGMCQGNLSDALARLKGETPAARTLATPRPPAVAVSFGALAGSRFHPVKVSPLHEIQAQAGAKFFRAGAWRRVDHFGDPAGEVRAVHQAAGLTDVSTVGKFKVLGPDAEKLLDRVYLSGLAKLAEPGRILYTGACNEAAALIDDGVILKTGAEEFYLTTTSARGPAAKEWFLRARREEKWRAWIVDLTEGLAAMNLAGPRSREILQRLTPADLSDSALPYLHWLSAQVAGVDCRLLRMGFLGELSYELHCPASLANHLWTELLQAGGDLGLRPIGLEAQNVCRLEKGHVIIGLDVDGHTTLLEAGLSWLWDRAKTDLIGGEGLRLLKDQPFKRQVVGFRLSGRIEVREGCSVTWGHERLGHVTSVRYSEALHQTVGLALIKSDPEALGRGQLKIDVQGREIWAEVVRPPFYDPPGERLRA